MPNTYKLISDYTLVSDIQNGDKLIGQRVDGTTVRIPYQQDISQDASPTLGGDLTLDGFNIGAATEANITTLASWSSNYILTSSFNNDILNFQGSAGTGQCVLGLDHTASSVDLDVLAGAANSALNINGQGTGGVKLGSDTSTYNIGTNSTGNYCVSSGSGNSLILQKGAHQASLFVADGGAAITVPTGTYTMAGQDVSHAGTGRNSHTANAIIAGGSSSTSAQQSLDVGTSGQFLISQGASTIPVWSYTLPAETTLNGNIIYDTSSTVAVSNGGTGRSSHTAYTLLAGGTTSIGAQQSLPAGTTGQVLASSGSGTLPAWTSDLDPSTTIGGDVIFTDATTIPVTNGGTNRTSSPAYAIIAGGTTTTGTQQSLPTGTAGQILLSGGASALPTWSTNLPPGTTIDGNNIYDSSDTIPVSNGGTGRVSHTAYGVLCGGTSSTAPQQSIASVGTSGQVLTSNGAGSLPTFQNVPAGTPATQSDQITGSSSSVYVSPSVQQYHKSAIRAWASFGTSGNITNSYNISSVTDTGVGQATVNYSSSMSGVTSVSLAVNTGSGLRIPLVGPSTTNCLCHCIDNAGAFVDPPSWYFSLFGNL